MQREVLAIFQKFGLQPDGRGCALLEHDGMKVVLQDCQEYGLVLYAAVGQLPENPASHLLAFLLNANLPGRAGLPGRTGLDETSRALVYSMAVPRERMYFEGVSEMLQQFTESARSLMGQIEELAGSGEEEAAAAADTAETWGFPMGMLRV